MPELSTTTGFSSSTTIFESWPASMSINSIILFSHPERVSNTTMQKTQRIKSLFNVDDQLGQANSRGTLNYAMPLTRLYSQAMSKQEQ